MNRGNLKRWLGGGLVLFLIWLLPSSAFSEKASIKEVRVNRTDGIWKVHFYVENCFTEKMEEAIQTGIKTTFTFYLDLLQKRSWWKDRKVASVKFHHTVQYIPLRGEYQVIRGGKGTTVATKNFEEAKKWMANVEALEIKPSSELNPKSSTYLRIKAELDPVKLPLHLEYLFFFVSLWDFETDWHVEPLSP